VLPCERYIGPRDRALQGSDTPKGGDAVRRPIRIFCL
jgi:hypothetical protein